MAETENEAKSTEETPQEPPKEPEPEPEFKPEFLEKMKIVYDVYNKSGNGLDSVDAADALRALDLMPTFKQIEGITGAKNRDEKILTVEEFQSLYTEVKKNPDVGGVDDFLQLFSLLDKNMNGKIILDDLKHYLKAVGEPLEAEQVDKFVKDCIKEKMDSDGFISYQPLLRRMASMAPNWVAPFLAERKAKEELEKEAFLNKMAEKKEISSAEPVEALQPQPVAEATA